MLKYIKKIKQCIYDAYKANIAIFNKKKYSYTYYKTHIDIHMYLFKNGRPYFKPAPKVVIVSDNIFLPDNDNIYKISINHVSVMDGFVPIDFTFDSLITEE